MQEVSLVNIWRVLQNYFSWLQKKILMSLQSTIEYGLLYKSVKKVRLIGFINNHRKSVSSYVSMSGNNAYVAFKEVITYYIINRYSKVYSTTYICCFIQFSYKTFLTASLQKPKYCKSSYRYLLWQYIITQVVQVSYSIQKK